MAQWNFGEVILAAIANQERINQERQAEADRAAQAFREDRELARRLRRARPADPPC